MHCYYITYVARYCLVPHPMAVLGRKRHVKQTNLKTKTSATELAHLIRPAAVREVPHSPANGPAVRPPLSVGQRVRLALSARVQHAISTAPVHGGAFSVLLAA
jgi:hypothetical protein